MGRPAAKRSTDTIGENQGPGPTGREDDPGAEDAGTVTFGDNTAFDDAGRQSRARWLEPLLGGLFTTALIILTLAAAVVLGAQEGILVASRGSGGSTAIPSPVLPSVTPVPSPLAVAPSATLSYPSPTILPTETSAASCSLPTGWQVHAVRPGETLAAIAARYNTSVAMLYKMNCLNSTALSQGQAIYVPGSSYRTATATSKPRCYVRTDWVLYTVRQGDTLYSIAKSVKITVAALKQANCLVSDYIYIGQRLRVPYIPRPTTTPAPTATPAPTGSPTDTPTGPPPTDTPTGEPPTGTPPGEPPTSTPTGEPPTDTPTPEPPTDTPSPPPPTDTPVPPPTDTPLPPPPTDTPVPPPTDTPVPPPPTDTPVPPPGAPVP